MIKIKDYPKVNNKFEEFIKKLLQNWATAISDETPEITDEMVKDMIEPLLQSNPRVLYDFLDENHVYLQPALKEQLNPDAGWGYELSSVLGSGGDNDFKTRKEAELEGFNSSIKMLEELL